MLEIVLLDASDPLPVVDDFCPWLDECVEDYIPVEVDDGDAGETVALRSQDALAV